MSTAVIKLAPSDVEGVGYGGGSGLQQSEYFRRAVEQAVETLDARYTEHVQAAREIAEQYFGARRVLSALLDDSHAVRSRGAAGRRRS